MHSSLAALRAIARRHSRVEDETDDLLQDALLEAVRAGRADLTEAMNYRWVVGTLKKLGALSARGAVRRRLREARWSTEHAADAPASPTSRVDALPLAWQRHPALDTLPPSLRQVAMLALSGHERREIAWLLDLTDTALRKRISTLRKHLSARGSPHALRHAEASVNDHLPLGLIRRALLPVVVATDSAGTHDPDGHLLVFGRAAGPDAHISRARGNFSKQAVPFPPRTESSE